VLVVQLTSRQEVGWSRYLGQSSKNKPYRRLTALKKSPQKHSRISRYREAVELGLLRIIRQGTIENSCPQQDAT